LWSPVYRPRISLPLNPGYARRSAPRTFRIKS
jgi:hypothetical protein